MTFKLENLKLEAIRITPSGQYIFSEYDFKKNFPNLGIIDILCLMNPIDFCLGHCTCDEESSCNCDGYEACQYVGEKRGCGGNCTCDLD